MLEPLSCLLVRAEHAPMVVSPAYDALTPAQRADAARARPRSWLNVTGSPTRPGQRGDDADLVGANRRALERLLADGLFERVRSCLFLYRLTTAEHQQTGVVGHVPIAAASDGRLLGHERSNPDRVAALEANLDRVAATSSPVAVAWRAPNGLDALYRSLTGEEPAVDVTVAGDVRQQVWTVTDPAAVDALAAAVGPGPLFIVDGHHRTAAAVAHAAHHRSRSIFDDRLLVAAFPHSQLRLAPFHRLVHAETIDLAELPGSHRSAGPIPPPAGSATMVDSAGRWWSTRLPPGERLDVARLHDGLLGPRWGITPDDDRLSFVPGHLGLEELARRAVAEQATGFALAPPTVETVLDIAASGSTMPPKATFFHPKVRSGIFVRLHDPADERLLG